MMSPPNVNSVKDHLARLPDHVVLVWRLDRWGRSLIDLVVTFKG
jgi:hypothetical protein